MDGAVLTLRGKPYQARGAATLNALDAIIVLILGSASKTLSDERNDLVGSMQHVIEGQKRKWADRKHLELVEESVQQRDTQKDKITKTSKKLNNYRFMSVRSIDASR